MIRFTPPSPTVEFVDGTADYLELVADRHDVGLHLSHDGTHWNVVVPLPDADLVIVYRAPVAASERVSA